MIIFELRTREAGLAIMAKEQLKVVCLNYEAPLRVPETMCSCGTRRKGRHFSPVWSKG